MDALGGNEKKCSRAIIPLGDWQRQGKYVDLCDYRYVCAIKLMGIEFGVVRGWLEHREY
jgi:hypothetical protein